MVDFSVPEETRMIVDTVRRFVRTELNPLEDAIEHAGAISPEMARSVRDKSLALGLYGMSMPEDVGGAGLSAVDFCLVEEEFGWTKDVLVRRAFGCIPDSLVNCVGEQREKYLFPAVRGDIHVAFGLTEPEAGSDAAGIRTTAREDGDHFVINGSKHFISDADIAAAFLVTAVTDPGRGAKGITAFLIDRDTPGFKVGRVQEMMGLTGLNHCELVFEDCRIHKDQILGERGGGLFQVLSFLNRVRLGNIGARAVGTASRLLDMATSYAAERKQFGKKIGEFQMVQAMLADSAAEIHATRSMVLATAWEVDQGLDPRDKVSMVKFYAAEMLGRVADRAVQVFGGMGYCKEMPLERLYRDARIYRIFDGTSEIHRMVVARSLLKEKGLKIS